MIQRKNTIIDQKTSKNVKSARSIGFSCGRWGGTYGRSRGEKLHEAEGARVHLGDTNCVRAVELHRRRRAGQVGNRAIGMMRIEQGDERIPAWPRIVGQRIEQGGLRNGDTRNGPARRKCRFDERVQPVLSRQAGRGAGPARVVARPPGNTGLPARRAQHGDLDDSRGQVRAVRRRHATALRDELRRPVGLLHAGLLHVGADPGALRRHLQARRGLRRAARPRRRPVVRPRRSGDRGRVRAQLRRHREGDPEGASA